MAFDRSVSDFTSGAPAAAWWTVNYDGQSPQTQAWQGANVFNNFKSRMRTANRIPTLSAGTAITQADLQALQAWLTSTNQPRAAALIAEALSAGRFTPGALRVIIAIATDSNFDWISLPANVRAPAFGTAPAAPASNAMQGPAYWPQGTTPPSSVPVAPSGGGGGGSGVTPANTPAVPVISDGAKTLFWVLVIGIPIVLAVIIGLIAYFVTKKNKQPESKGSPSRFDRYVKKAKLEERV